MDPAIVGSIIGSFISASCTLLTATITVLIAVWQIRRSQKVIIRESFGNAIGREHDLILKAVDDPASVNWLLNRFKIDGVSEENKRFYIYTILEIDNYSLIFYRFSRDEFPEELWPQYRVSMIESFATPVFKEIWNSDFRKIVTREFVKYVEDGFPDIKRKKFVSW